MTIKEASKLLNISPQLLRVWCKNGCPFITIIRAGERNTYLVNEAKMKLWLEGKI